ncbi:hypothetical protein RDWZM_008279 [Blomia tropicalis]|uniref:poly(A)-specific ribonuclease n=1 Tax=Blomia tropicalis TaxID=40697 RepID=A0A9Q0M3C0_BLOTA|nr:hypothetical protein RDWZM_008279 [Blomia tropicalis]
MSRPGHRDREKYEPPNPRRNHVILQADAESNGKDTAWFELEITGSVRNLSPQLWAFTHLTALYLNENCLTRVPPDICRLTSLQHLDLSSNKLRSLPSEIGDLIMLRELLLNHNILRCLPYELGKLFQIQNLGLKGNPLTQELLVIYNEPNGTQKLLAYLLDNLPAPMSISDLFVGEGSSFDSIELHSNKIGNLPFANQSVNNLSQFKEPSSPVNSFRPFGLCSSEFLPQTLKFDTSSEPIGYGSLKFPPQVGIPNLGTTNQNNDRLALSSLGSPSPISFYSSDSSSSASTSPPTSNPHSEMSDLGFSMARLALHAEGAPIIVCEENGIGSKRNSSGSSLTSSNGTNVTNNGRSTRRRYYRLLHSLPPPHSGSSFPYSEVDAFSYSATSLSTAYHRYQQNVAYFYQHHPSLYQGPIIPTAEASFQHHYQQQSQQLQYQQNQYMLHHHYYHHVHYHHHLHSKQSQPPQFNMCVEDNVEASFGRNESTMSLAENTCCDYRQRQTNANTQSSDLVHSSILKGTDLIFHHDQSDLLKRQFRPIGSEMAKNRNQLATVFQSNAALSDSQSYNTPSATLAQTLFKELIDETSSLDGCSLDDASDSIYSSVSTSPCSSSSSSSTSSNSSCKVEAKNTLTRDQICDVRHDLSAHNSSVCTPTTLSAKSSPMCSLTVSSLDEISLTSSLPSSPSSFTSSSSLIFSTELHQNSSQSSLASLVDSDYTTTEYIQNIKPVKLPRTIKARKRKKKEKPTIRNLSSNLVSFKSNQTQNGSHFETYPIKRNYLHLSINRIQLLPNWINLHICFSLFDSYKNLVPNSTPPQRPWIPLKKPSESNIANVFTVMCYNVLCDKYATRQLYGYCPNWALSWDYRRNAIMQEIKNFDADIISLQEVETEQFFNYFKPQLAVCGYDGIFSPKSRAKTMTESERRHVDGCAIFFKTDKFSLVKEHLIEFNQLAMANAEGSDNMLNRVMTKDNIGLVALLQTKDGDSDNLSEPSMAAGQPLVVCTAHIHWDPEYCDVKLIQTMMLMHELRTFVDEAATMFRLNSSGAKVDPASLVPLILCCDLNSLPNSGVVEFLNKGRIAVDHVDFKELAYKDCLRKLFPIVSENLKGNSNDYSHSFDLIKAYKDDVMPFTNYTYEFKGVIDYIFCSKMMLNVLGVLGPLDTNWLRENKIYGCPHQYIPSDHFPLVAELEMTPSKLSPGLVSSNTGSNASGAANGHLIRR